MRWLDNENHMLDGTLYKVSAPVCFMWIHRTVYFGYISGFMIHDILYYLLIC